MPRCVAFVLILAMFAALTSACRDAVQATGGPCATTKDCGAGNICIAGTCTERAPGMGCKTDDACAADELCDKTTGDCVPANDPGNVPGGTCTEDQACPAHQRCDELTGRCVNGRRDCADDT